MNRVARASRTRRRGSSQSAMATIKSRTSKARASRPDALAIGDRHVSARTKMVRFLNGKCRSKLARSVAMCKPIAQGFRCNKPMLCDSCWVADSYSAQASATGRAFVALVANPHLMFVHATLGAGTFPTWQSGVAAVQETLARLRRNGPSSWKRVRGGYWVLEIERRENGAYAPHLHAILAFDATDPPRSFRSVGFDWARVMRQVRLPNRTFDPANDHDALHAELRESQRITPLHAYGIHSGFKLPNRTSDLRQVMEHVWRVVGYARKSKRVASGGTSQETRHLSMTARLAIHEARVRRRNSFGVLRASWGFGVDLQKLGEVVARALHFGPSETAVSESRLVPIASPPPRAVIEFLRNVKSSKDPSLRFIARRALRVSRSLALVGSKPPHLREKERRARCGRGQGDESS